MRHVSILVGVIFAFGLMLNSSAAEAAKPSGDRPRSEEHTSELQSRTNLVCRLLLEKKKKKKKKKNDDKERKQKTED